MIKGTREVEIEEGENSSSIRILFVFLEMESPPESSYYGSHLDLINIPLRLEPIPPPLLGKCREERGGWIDCQFINFFSTIYKLSEVIQELSNSKSQAQLA